MGWARELPINRRIRVIVHFPESEVQRKAAQNLAVAFHSYFSHRAAALQGDLTELFRIDRRSIGIGVLVLIACFALAHFASGLLAESPFRRLVEESFLILGCVANWRPLENFLYDWWPIVRRRDLYRRLSKAIGESRSFPVNNRLVMLPTDPLPSAPSRC